MEAAIHLSGQNCGFFSFQNQQVRELKPATDLLREGPGRGFLPDTCGRAAEESPKRTGSQRVKYSLVSEYALKYIGVLDMI